MSLRTYKIMVALYICAMLLGGVIGSITLSRVPDEFHEMRMGASFSPLMTFVFTLNYSLWLIGLTGLIFLVSMARHVCVVALAVDMYLVTRMPEWFVVTNHALLLSIGLALYIGCVLTISYMSDVGKYFKRDNYTSFVYAASMIAVMGCVIYLWLSSERDEPDIHLSNSEKVGVNKNVVLMRTKYGPESPLLYYTVESSRLQSVPSWRGGNPPLSIGDLLAVLYEVEDIAIGDIGSITLRRFESESPEWDEFDVWYYSVWGGDESGGRLQHIVLMDGSVVRPVEQGLEDGK